MLMVLLLFLIKPLWPFVTLQQSITDRIDNFIYIFQHENSMCPHYANVGQVRFFQCNIYDIAHLILINTSYDLYVRFQV